MKTNAITGPVKSFKVLITNLTVRYAIALVTMACLVGVSPFLTLKIIEQQEDNRKLMIVASQLSDLSSSLSQTIILYQLTHNDDEKQRFAENISELVEEMSIQFPRFYDQAGELEWSPLNSMEYSTHLKELRSRYQPILLVKKRISQQSAQEGKDSDVNARLALQSLFDSTHFSRAVQNCILDLEKVSASKLSIFSKFEWIFTSILIIVLMLQGVFVLRPAVKKVGKTLTDLNNSEQKLLEAKEEAVEAFKVRSNFVTKISHEIRNPLNAILGMGDLILETPLDIGQRRYAEISRRAGQSVLDLINDFLDFSRLEAGKLELESIRFDLIETVERAIDIVANRAEEKGLQLYLDFDPDLACEFSGDPRRIQQILVNLLGNAIKFSHSGEVVLRIKQGGIQSSRAQIEFLVTDTGIGIPKDLQNRIFDSFVQVDSSITRKFGGTGLGLAICRDLTKMMGGRITLESVEGRGSTFKVFLPLEQTDSETFLRRLGRVSWNDIRILILGHNQMRSRAMGSYLERLGAEVVAQNELHLESLAQYQVILIDQNWISEVTAYVQTLPSPPKVVCLSNLRDLRQNTSILNNQPGFFCIPKPVKVSQLVGILNDVQQEKAHKYHALSINPTPKASFQHAGFSVSHSIKILVVEDSEDNRLVMQAYLKANPYLVTFAHHGKEAVKKYREVEFDLIFMDIQMPEMDGFTATREIRVIETAEKRKKIPIVALSAYGHKEEIEKCIQSGCDRHLTKPIRKAVLLQVIEEVLRKETE